MKIINSRSALIGVLTSIVLFCYNLRPGNPWYLLPLAYSEKMGLPEKSTVFVFYILLSILTGYIIYRLLNRPLPAKLLYLATVMYIFATKVITCILLINANDFSTQDLFVVYIPGLIVIISSIIIVGRLWIHRVSKKMSMGYSIIMILLISYTLIMQIIFTFHDYTFLEEWESVYIIDSSIKTHLKYISPVFTICMLLWLIIRDMSMIKKQSVSYTEKS